MKIISQCIAGLISILPITVSANPVSWEFSNVTFSDGAIVTGNFVLDSTAPGAGTISSWTINISGGNVGTFPNYSWTSSNSTSYYQHGVGGFVSNQIFPPIPPNYYYPESRVLDFYTQQPLNSASGIANLTWLNDCYDCSPFRSMVSAGQLVAQVPELSTYVMMFTGLGLIGFISYRRKNDSLNIVTAV